jgi:pilus assembly protein FimV
VAAAVAATLGVLMLHWPAAHAMTLGVPRVNSALGQPLDLMIPAQSENPNELSGECLRLLPAPDSDIPTLTAGRILVERDGLLTTLRIRSLDPINEPAFRVVLEAGCQRRMQREYVLLLDPPPLRDVAPAGVGTGAAAPVVVPGAPAPSMTLNWVMPTSAPCADGPC